MKILITGFEPFGDEKVNPSFEVVKKLHDSYGSAEIIKLQVPVVYHKSIDLVINKIKDLQPAVVLMLGQAGGRTDITIERIAININDSRLADNEGVIIEGEPICDAGAPAHFSTLPVKQISVRIREKGIPASVSNTAGAYICNQLMYGVLRFIDVNKLAIRAGFIHIPYLHEQVTSKNNTASMAMDTMIAGIESAIATLIEEGKTDE